MIFKSRRPQSTDKKSHIPTTIWIILAIASIFGMLLTKTCHKNLDKLLEIKNVQLEMQSIAVVEISFEIENKANFYIERKVISVVFINKNYEVGSKMILAQLPAKSTKGYYVSINLTHPLIKGENIDVISVKFYD